MFLSIITVVRNGADVIGPTIESVNAQTFRDFEHLVIDGLSNDGTSEVVNRLSNKENLRFYSGKDSGIYDAMNKGLDMATGDYVLFLNAGDRLHSPDALETVARLARENNIPGIIYGQTDIVDQNGNYLGPRHLSAPKELTLSSFREGMLVCHQAFYALRKLVGRYDLKYRFSSDYDWCIRALQHSNNNVYADAVLADYLNEGATTKNRFKSLRERASIMAQYSGVVPPLFRHIGFAFRALKRRLK